MYTENNPRGIHREQPPGSKTRAAVHRTHDHALSRRENVCGMLCRHHRAGAGPGAEAATSASSFAIALLPLPL